MKPRAPAASAAPTVARSCVAESTTIGSRGMLAAQLGEQVEPVRAGQREVEQHERAVRMPREHRERLVAIAGAPIVERRRRGPAAPAVSACRISGWSSTTSSLTASPHQAQASGPHRVRVEAMIPPHGAAHLLSVPTGAAGAGVTRATMAWQASPVTGSDAVASWLASRLAPSRVRESAPAPRRGRLECLCHNREQMELICRQATPAAPSRAGWTPCQADRQSPSNCEGGTCETS